MYSFEGDFRRKPQQNLAGASAQRKDRDSLILQTQQQRQKREISISQVLLRQWKKILENGGSMVQIRRILVLHLLLLNIILKREESESQLSLAVPLRMIEVFTSIYPSNSMRITNDTHNKIAQTILYLVQRGYFKTLRSILDTKTPPLYGVSPNAPTPLCSSLLDLLQRPLSLITHSSVQGYDNEVSTEFAATFMCSPYTDPVEMFVIPALAYDPIKKFPFLRLIQVLNDVNKFQSGTVVNNTWFLHSVLTMEPKNLASQIRSIESTKLTNNPIVLDYLSILAHLTSNIRNKKISDVHEGALHSEETAADRDLDSDSENELSPVSIKETKLLTTCIELLNEPNHLMMETCSQITENDLSDLFLEYISQICHNLLLSNRMAIHKYRLLYTLAFKPVFLRKLWHWISSQSHESSFGGSPTPLLSALSRGLGAETAVLGVEKLLAPLAVFCSLFSLLIGTLHDSEFGKEENEEEVANASANLVHAFRFDELGALCRTLRQVCLGLVELAYPETRPCLKDRFRVTVNDEQPSSTNVTVENHTPAWSHLFKVCTQLLHALYARDSRLHFCDSWTVEGAVPPGMEAVITVTGTHARPNPRPMRRPPRLANILASDEEPPMTIKELRTVTILREIPFIVPFSTRVLVFQGLVLREKYDNQMELSGFLEGPNINITVRRTHIYEDAFKKLNPEKVPDLKFRMRVQMVNQAGAEEAGVDGGGLFREFLCELLKSAFDPNRGLFRLTNDNMLYPNPGVHLLYDDFHIHYYFVGRMLAKGLYENVLVEIPLAEFFLSKLCSSREPDVHTLASLDPDLYRGLLMLKAHKRQDVQELGLDFTIVNDELGEQSVDELKPGGANIPVTAENRIEYIHLVADYKLNRQIRSQCVAFKRGFNSIVSPIWLKMFSCRELQLLISGAEVPIDIDDLRNNTHYGGGLTAEHPTVQCFWRVMSQFTDTQRRQLLKFVTSCSRPPLLGFKDLDPPFCIQSAGSTDRLPSASTCMNLLKLPELQSEEILAEKLIYAINAGAGFELS
ncbi:Ubiquitin-protein ligase E3C [Eumeta japonica]|uniref:Ubiquitin-protein ligase E3C n=1 Tax=Eumeta variegata TaxID=151549 RepID=A0A4C1TBS4_EUMVA|nr:Ubiquitin-protein ligase E3C [Eumeta japonica]